MPVTSNAQWFDVNLVSEYFSDENVYFNFDNIYKDRPAGITKFIGIQCEPNAISNIRDVFINDNSKYDIILAHDEEILKACPTAIPYVFGTCWILPEVYNNIDISRKLPKISTMSGWKTWTDGHLFRRTLYFNQKSIDLPITWYRSGARDILPEITSNPILKSCSNSKSELFLEYQYSLVIENNRTANYFTEKLIDCLMTKTIPIYWGCTNIEKWFDTTGWIILETTDVNELVEKCKNLPTYSDNLEIMNKNHGIARKFISLEQNIIDALGLTNNT
jgi:hypothetical protein